MIGTELLNEEQNALHWFITLLPYSDISLQTFSLEMILRTLFYGRKEIKVLTTLGVKFKIKSK